MLPEFVRQEANMTWCANADLKAGHEGHVRVRGCDCVCKIIFVREWGANKLGNHDERNPWENTKSSPLLGYYSLLLDARHS